jgi:hypothetical protein
MTGKITIDLTWAKNALFVRQTVAQAFGVPLDREFTWDMLRAAICRADNPRLPDKIYIVGRSHASLDVPNEARALDEFLAALKVVRPHLQITVQLH